jgi:hypothetical protein
LQCEFSSLHRFLKLKRYVPLFGFLNGDSPNPAPASPKQPADPYPGLTLAANVLGAIGLGFGVAGKQTVLGDFSDETNPLGVRVVKIIN